MLALLTSMLSPLAGLFLGVAAAALVVCGYRRQGLSMGLAAAVPLSVTLAIPDTGRQPIGIQDLLLPLVAVAAVLADVPREWRASRAGAAIYAVGTAIAHGPAMRLQRAIRVSSTDAESKRLDPV